MKLTFVLLLSFFIAQLVQAQITAEVSTSNFIIEFDKQFSDEVYKDEKRGLALIDSLKRFIAHSDEKMRVYTRFKLAEIGIRNGSIKVKTHSLNQLLKFSYDSNGTIKRNTAKVYRAFPKTAFSDSFISELKSILHNDSLVCREHILLVGFLDLSEEKDYLKNHFVEVKGSLPNDTRLGDVNSFSFAAKMAIARMGEKEHVSFVIDKILDARRKDVLNKRVAYLSYLKQPAAIETLLAFVLLDRMVMNSSGHYYLSASYVLPEVSKSVQDFPIPYKSFPIYSDDEIIKARAWVLFNLKNYKINRENW